MTLRTTLAATLAALSLIAVSGCAVTRGQETVGAYVDDSAITTAVKARYVENKDVDASSIRVCQERYRKEHGRERRAKGQGREVGEEPDRRAPVSQIRVI